MHDHVWHVASSKPYQSRVYLVAAFSASCVRWHLQSTTVFALVGTATRSGRSLPSARAPVNAHGAVRCSTELDGPRVSQRCNGDVPKRVAQDGYYQSQLPNASPHQPPCSCMFRVRTLLAFRTCPCEHVWCRALKHRALLEARGPRGSQRCNADVPKRALHTAVSAGPNRLLLCRVWLHVPKACIRT